MGPNPLDASRPIPGPAPLAASERLWGRSGDREYLINILCARRVVVLTGRSGVGKTSLLFAQDGVAAQIADRFNVLRLQPAYRLAAFLRGQADLAPAAAAAPLLLPVGEDEATLAAAPDDVAALWGRPANQSAPGPLPQLLVIDRIEDLLGLEGPRRRAVEGLFMRLDQLTTEPGGLHILLIVQEEYLVALERYKECFTDKLQLPCPLEPLSEAAVRGGIRDEVKALGSRAAPWQDQQVTQLIDDSAAGATVDLRMLRSGLFAIWSGHYSPTLRQKVGLRIARIRSRIRRSKSRDRRLALDSLSDQAVMAAQLAYLPVWLDRKLVATQPELSRRRAEQAAKLLVQHFVDLRGRRAWCRRSIIKKSARRGRALDRLLDEMYRAGIILRYQVKADEYAFLLTEDVIRQIATYSRQTQRTIKTRLYGLSGAVFLFTLLSLLSISSVRLYERWGDDQATISQLQRNRDALNLQLVICQKKLLQQAKLPADLNTCQADLDTCRKAALTKPVPPTDARVTANKDCPQTPPKSRRHSKPSFWTWLKGFLWDAFNGPKNAERGNSRKK